MSKSTATIGIDLAARSANTALCAIEWTPAKPILRHLYIGDQDGTELHDKFLVTAISAWRLDLGEADVVKAAIDAPFGWPEPFVEAVRAHRDGDGWPNGIDDPRTPFLYRDTDRFVRNNYGKQPLSVSGDKIGVVAIRCAVLLNYLRIREGPAAVDPAGSGLVCETYPDPALRFWTADDDRPLLPGESYKGAKRAARRLELLESLVSKLSLGDPHGLLDMCATSDHGMDALLCALVARASWLGQTTGNELLPGAASTAGSTCRWVRLRI